MPFATRCRPRSALQDLNTADTYNNSFTPRFIILQEKSNNNLLCSIMCLSRLPFGLKAQSIAIVCVALLDSQLRWKSLKQICRSVALEFDGVESQRLETGSRALKTAKTFQHVAIAMPAIGLLPLFSQTQDAQPDRTQKAASNFVFATKFRLRYLSQGCTHINRPTTLPPAQHRFCRELPSAGCRSRTLRCRHLRQSMRPRKVCGMRLLAVKHR